MATNNLYLWRLKSAGDDQYYQLWLETDVEPTVISFDGTHAVVPGSGAILQSRKAEAPRLNNEDGRLMMAPVIYPDYMNPYYTSSGDDYDNGIRGGGIEASCMCTANGTTTTHEKMLKFVDFIHIIGGVLTVSGANFHDRMNTYVQADATPVTFNGSNLGNCNLYDVSGGYDLYHMIIPAAGDGTHDVDLETPMNENLAGPSPIFVSQATPLPAFAPDGVTTNGFWNWAELDGTITPAYAQDGSYNLYDFPITLTRYVQDIIVGTGIPNTSYNINLTVNHRSGPFLPHWKLVLAYTIDESHTPGDEIYFNTLITSARRKTVN
jgi:hypothetical protein